MEIVVDKNHIRCFFAHVSSILAHGDTDVSTFQSNTIVDTIARHAHNVARVLQRFDNREFVLWRDAIEHADIIDDFLELHLVHLVDVMTADGLLVDGIEADELGC